METSKGLTEEERNEKLKELTDRTLEGIIENIGGELDNKRKQEVIKAQLQNLKTIKELIDYKPIKKRMASLENYKKMAEKNQSDFLVWISENWAFKFKSIVICFLSL